MNNEMIHSFLETSKVKCLEHVAMSDYTHTKTGGTTPYMFFPKDVGELTNLLGFLTQNTVEYVILGSMTNIAVASGKLEFVVVNMTELNQNQINYDATTRALEVSSSVLMKDLSRWALNHSVSDLQWMEGIPGTVGAGAFMNAGFLKGQDFQSFLIDAVVLMPDLTIQTITNKQMEYRYRFSSLQASHGIVLSVRLLVRMGKKYKIFLRMLQYHRRRARNQPLEYPSAGTVFIPPTPYHVGGMLSHLKLKGYSIGGAQISEKSPGFIINTGNMTGEDYYHLIRYIQRIIRKEYQLDLSPEVRLLGFKTNEKDK